MYLENYNISERIYTTGLYDHGITIYKQQVRSLNLFYAMYTTGLINKESSICVFGGGIAGLTISSALMQAGCNVTLIEKESIFANLQFGCDIRQVHPHIYDWPSPSATYPYAKLPILNWKASSASNVSKQIVQSFYETKSKCKHGSYYLDINVLEKNNFTIHKNKGDDFFSISVFGRLNGAEKPTEENLRADYLVYCTGFGIEKGTENEGRTPSYWRNDDYSQTIVNNRKVFFISGCGDGALIDLFRLKILGFNYESFLRKFLLINEDESLSEKDRLMEKLNSIKNEWDKRDLNQTNWLYQQFNKLSENSSYKTSLNNLKSIFFEKRLRNNIDVTLIAEKDIMEIYDLNKVSFLNTFIFHLLRNCANSFKYVEGRTEKDKKGYYIVSKDRNDKPMKYHVKLEDTLIIRHGTDRKNAFAQTNIKDNFLDDLEIKQKDTTIQTDKKIWTYKSLIDLFAYKNKEDGYCSNETVAFCSNFISVLNKMIRLACQNEKILGDYKMTLYRVINLDNEDYYQQISPFFGSKDSKGSVGKIFPYNQGNVGMSIVSGEPILLLNDETFPELIKLANLNDSITKSDQSFLSIPILADLKDGNKAVNLILYISSNSLTFFDNGKVIMTIVHGLMGFIESVQKSLDKRLSMGDVTFEPIPITSKFDEIETVFSNYRTIKESSSCVDILKQFPSLNPSKSAITFERFYSFDIYHKEIFFEGNDIFS